MPRSTVVIAVLVGDSVPRPNPREACGGTRPHLHFLFA